MKKYLILFLCAATFAACSEPQGQSEENSALVEAYVAAVANMDAAAMEQYLADDYIGYGPSVGHETNKDQAILSWKENVASLYQKIDYNESQILTVTVASGPNAGEWVSHWANLDITYQTGKKVTIMANSIYLVEEGKIAKSYTFYNEADALSQLGYVFINPDNIWYENSIDNPIDIWSGYNGNGPEQFSGN